MNWLADLSALAEKAEADWNTHGEEFVNAAIEPERVRALCELAEAARDVPHDVVKAIGSPPKPICDEDCGACLLEPFLAALAGLEPAREEET